MPPQDGTHLFLVSNDEKFVILILRQKTKTELSLYFKNDLAYFICFTFYYVLFVHKNKFYWILGIEYYESMYAKHYST